MEIGESKHGAVTVLRPEAALVAEDAQAFAERVGAALGRGVTRLVIDCSRVTHADSAGLESLVDTADRLRDSGTALCLVGANETLREAFELTETASSFGCFADVSAAVRSFL